MQKSIEDEESVMLNPGNWMLREANKHQVLLNYATFQASLLSCIEEKIAACWIKFLALIDRNDNLLLLEDKENLWIDLLHVVMENAIDSNEDDEDAKMHNFTMRSTFPFSSFIVKDITDQINSGFAAKGFLFIYKQLLNICEFCLFSI